MLLIKEGRVIDPESGRDEGKLVIADGKVADFLPGGELRRCSTAR